LLLSVGTALRCTGTHLAFRWDLPTNHVIAVATVVVLLLAGASRLLAHLARR